MVESAHASWNGLTTTDACELPRMVCDEYLGVTVR